MNNGTDLYNLQKPWHEIAAKTSPRFVILTERSKGRSRRGAVKH